MRLDDLDVEIVIQGRSDFLSEDGQKVHTQRHIPRTNDRRLSGRSRNLGQMFILETCGADHMHNACFRSFLGKGNRRNGRGKINDSISICKRGSRIIRDNHAQRSATHSRANILTNPCMARPFNRTYKTRLVRFDHGFDQHLTHAARSSGDHNTW